MSAAAAAADGTAVAAAAVRKVTKVQSRQVKGPYKGPGCPSGQQEEQRSRQRGHPAGRQGGDPTFCLSILGSASSITRRDTKEFMVIPRKGAGRAPTGVKFSRPE